MDSDYEVLWPEGPKLIQAAHFRLGTDCVLLADFVNTTGMKYGIDLGCASGAAMVMLLAKEEKLHMTGLEIVATAAEAARENMKINGFEERSRVVTGDIRESRKLFQAGSFHLVVCNPPYFPKNSGKLPQSENRAAARSELLCSLQECCAAAAFLLQTGGKACFVHRPERLSELFVAMTVAGIEPKRLRTVCKNSVSPPSLVLVEGRRGGRPGVKIEPALYLQNDDGTESREYLQIYHRSISSQE